MFQIIKDFDRVVEAQQKSFLSCKLAWLECAPKILHVSKSEGGANVQYWLQQLDEGTDEGAY